MLIDCEHCGKSLNRKPSALRNENYCDKNCRSNAKHVEGHCGTCGIPMRKLRCAVSNPDNMFCSISCSHVWMSARMTAMDRELNPTRMIPETRAKLREARLNTGAGRSYAKTYSRHTHRIVAEQKLGRPLLPGEVVHHEDENKRNNHPDNLRIFKSQAEHAAYHALKNKIKCWIDKTFGPIKNEA